MVQLGLSDGWFEGEDFNNPEVGLGEVVDSVRELRNALHPGRQVREFGPHDEIGENLCRAVFNVLDAVFAVSSRLIEARTERTVHTAVTPQEGKTPD